MVEWKLKKAKRLVVIDRFLGKDAKTEEYDINMHRNNVYDGI